MALTDEQADALKEQLISQIKGSNIENKEKFIEQITGLDNNTLEDFLRQNNIPNPYSSEKSQEDTTPTENKCIFCQIINKKIPSTVLSENDKAISVLELNPLSRGHTIILPKQHLTTDKIPKQALSLAQKSAKIIKTKLHPLDIKIETSSFQDHSFINVIPIYKDTKFEKHKADEKELKELKEILETKKRASRKKKTDSTTQIIESSEKKDKIPRLGFRIP
jgi:histidine triad (HIT) family protein